jgi:hypothetical protein
MKRNHAREAGRDSVRKAPSQRISAPEPASQRWQALQGSIGNAAVARLLEGTPKTDDAFVHREPDDEPLPEDQAPAPLSERPEGGESEAEPLDTNRKLTKDEAIALVDKHVEPKECFVWYEGTKKGWRPMPGTGCAHWVAHERGYTAGLKCDKGYTVRVRNITENLKKVELKDVQVGDLWENQTDASHIGFVRSVTKTGETVTGVEVEHDSVRSGGVVKTTFTEGLFYR